MGQHEDKKDGDGHDPKMTGKRIQGMKDPKDLGGKHSKPDKGGK